MLSRYRFAGIITVALAACAPAPAQELAPPGSGVTVHKLSLSDGLSGAVKYYVQGGSRRLQAMVRRVEWAENELSVIEQLQQLKLENVVHERRVLENEGRVLEIRTAQLTDPYYSIYPGGFIPCSPADPYCRDGFTSRSTTADTGGWGESSLRSALGWQLAAEATPEAALRMIDLLEQLQTDLDKELQALPPQERKAVQGPIDALRPRLAALPRREVAPPRSQPVVAPRTSGFAPVSQEPVESTGPVPRQTVPPDQERLRQQIMQMQQAVMQRQQEVFPQYPLQQLMARRR